jgi:hypothetical protein
MYDKKLFKKEIGFVGLIPLGERQYQIQVNGAKLKNARIKVIDTSEKVVQELVLNAQYTVLNLSTLRRGDYQIELEFNGQKQRVAVVF